MIKGNWRAWLAPAAVLSIALLAASSALAGEDDWKADPDDISDRPGVFSGEDGGFGVTVWRDGEVTYSDNPPTAGGSAKSFDPHASQRLPSQPPRASRNQGGYVPPAPRGQYGTAYPPQQPYGNPYQGGQYQAGYAPPVQPPAPQPQASQPAFGGGPQAYAPPVQGGQVHGQTQGNYPPGYYEPAAPAYQGQAGYPAQLQGGTAGGSRTN